MRCCALALLAAACGDNLSAPAYDAHFHIELARNDANRSAVVELLLHPVDEVQVRTPEGRASFDAEGFIHFSTFDHPYRLIVTADGESIEMQHRAPHLELTNRQAGRRHPARIRQSTQLSFEPAPPAPPLDPAGVLALATTGLWTFAELDGIDPTLAFDWREARALDGELGLLADTDRVFLLAYEPCTACAPHYALTRALDTSIAQVDGQRATITGELRTPAQRLDITATVQRGGELARVAPAFTFGAGFARWGLDSIPSHSLAPIGRLPLVISSDVGGTSDVTSAVVVHNPFAGTEVVGWLETSFFRTIEVSEQTTAFLPHGTLHFVPAGAQMSIAGTIGVPAHPVVDALPSRDRVVTWEQAIAGRIDDHVVTLFELDDVPGAPLILRHTIVTDDTRAVIAATLLEPDRVYIVRVEARLGYPEAAAGNYVTVELPYATATTWSNPFAR